MNSNQQSGASHADGDRNNEPGLFEHEDAISRSLVDARIQAKPLNGFPGELPVSMGRAYAIQDASINRWSDSVSGWKVGLLSAEDQERYSAKRLMGPIFSSQTHSVVSGSVICMPVFVGGFAAVEAEFVYRLGQTVQAEKRAWSDDELAEVVASFHVGAEIASSPMALINKLGPTVVTADFGNNAGLLVGPEIPEWQLISPASLPARVTINGEAVGEASAAAIPGGPVAALRFVLSTAAQRNLTLPAGTLISTGAATGIHDVEVTSQSRVEFGDYGWFEVTFEPMSDQR